MKGLRLLLIACCLLLLMSCRQNEQAVESTDWTPLQIAQVVFESQSELPPMTAILAGDALYDTYVTGYYLFDLNDIVDGAIFCADSASAQEIAVLRLAEEADINEAKEIFADYSQRRAGAFAGYLPDEASLVENASIVAQGDIIALLICREPELAEAAFQLAFTEDPPDSKAGSQMVDSSVKYSLADERLDSETPVSEAMESAVILQGPEVDTSSSPKSEPEVIPADTIEPEQEVISTDTVEPEQEVISTDTVEPEQEVISTDTMEPKQEVTPTNTTEPKPEPAPEVTADGELKPDQTDTFTEAVTPPQTMQAENTPWSYNSARLLDAWELGDWSNLVPQDQEILNVCLTVIGQSGFNTLTDYEKELAIHDWMLANGRYDTNRLSNLPEYQENPDNDNPYGFLICGVGICRGYTSTFQLFMDLLGIECISIQGQANSTRVEHAWNMVRLDGEWYCVDVTWDDPTTDMPVSAQTAHRYFNVTSDFMRTTGHYWDESNVPEASATSLAWGTSGSDISS